jgi:aryl-alcohol dehydrogenase
MKITAAVARTQGAPLTIEELELDDLRHGEVRVRMVAVGVCHTDAIVRDGSTSLSSNGEAISSHFFGQSSFATYANVVEESVVKVPSDVPLTHLGPLGCGFNTGAGTVLNELKPRIGSTLAVFGTGAVGAAAVMAANVSDCARIIAVDVHDSRLTLAKELGATHTINSMTQDLGEALAEITGGEGVDYVVDTTGRPELLRAAADAIAVRGTVALVGAARPGTEVSFEIGASMVKGWTFKTVVQGSSVPQSFLPQLIQLWREGRFPIDKLIKDYSLQDINQGFADSADGSTIKPVIVF